MAESLKVMQEIVRKAAFPCFEPVLFYFEKTKTKKSNAVFQRFHGHSSYENGGAVWITDNTTKMFVVPNMFKEILEKIAISLGISLEPYLAFSDEGDCFDVGKAKGVTKEIRDRDGRTQYSAITVMDGNETHSFVNSFIVYSRLLE